MRRLLAILAAVTLSLGLTAAATHADPAHKRTVYPEYRYKACNPHDTEGGNHVHVCVTMDVRRQPDGTGVQADQAYLFGYGPQSGVDCNIGSSAFHSDPAIVNNGFTVYNDAAPNILVTASAPDLYGSSCDVRYGFDNEPGGIVKAPRMSTAFAYKARLQLHDDSSVIGLEIHWRIVTHQDGTTAVDWWCDDEEIGRIPDVCNRQLL